MLVTALTETSPLPSETRALDAVKFAILLKAIAALALMSALTKLVIVLLSESIDLLVSVCVAAIPANVSVAEGSVSVTSAVAAGPIKVSLICAIITIFKKL